MKSGKRESVKGIEQPNQGCIGTLGEKENYKYLEILEEDIKKRRWAKKLGKSTSEVRESFSKPNTAA